MAEERIDEYLERQCRDLTGIFRPDMQVPMPCNLLEIKIGKNFHNLSLHVDQAVTEDDCDDSLGEWTEVENTIKGEW